MKDSNCSPLNPELQGDDIRQAIRDSDNPGTCQIQNAVKKTLRISKSDR